MKTRKEKPVFPRPIEVTTTYTEGPSLMAAGKLVRKSPAPSAGDDTPTGKAD